MAYNVLIASVQRDLELARDLAERVRDAGAHVLPLRESALPEEPGAAAASPATSDTALRKADEVVFLLTERSIESQALLFDLGAAFSLRKRVTPVVLGLTEPEIPPLIKQLPYVSYGDLKSYLADLGERAQAGAASPEPLRT